ncbi:unnamed protein product [Durusdinium trenchii]|uniref:DNA (cytosine-5-)-methyltransferase n=1 Tax=Durusdinium trenchii TaxID=1381693 RepID=A0ABP0LQE2_9DINO
MLFFVKFSLYQDHGYDYIPQRIIDWLEAGPTFLQDSGLMPWFRRFGHSSQFTYASDCSGADGPFQALDMLFTAARVRDTLEFLSASEINRSKREFLEMNFPSQVSVYCAGFPCQPYSLLSSTRRMMYDENSSQLVKVVKRLRKYRPKIVVLENVMGFYCLVDALIEVLHANCSGYAIMKYVCSPCFG